MWRRILAAGGLFLAAAGVHADEAARHSVELTFIAPQLGGVSGGYIVNVYGDKFENSTDLSCDFRDLGGGTTISTRATFVSSAKLTCVAPSVERAARSTIYVNDGVEDSVNGIPFDYVYHAIITSIEPKRGPSSGGTVVNLHGSGFVNSNRLECDFGNATVQATWLSMQHLECEVPALDDGFAMVDIAVNLNGVPFSSNHADFQYYNEPIISTIHPWVGTPDGGTMIAVIGSGFSYSDSIFCRIGASTVAGKFINKGSISCVTPPQAESPTTVDVAITLNGADYHASATHYKYTDPEIRAVRPQKGYYFGGTKINITGSNFEDTEQLACVFDSPLDGRKVTAASFRSSTDLQCTTPAVSEPGHFSIRVSLNGVDVSQSSTDFITAAPAEISSMTPESASTSGLSKVHLIGKGFLSGDETACRFGNTTVPAEWVSPTVVMCKPISLNPNAGYTTVSYTNDGVHFIDAEHQFLFIHVPTVLSVGPRSGLRSGGSTVLFALDKISTALEWTCSFGGREVQATVISSRKLQCESPFSDQDLVPISLLLKEHDLEVETGFAFQYYEPLEIESIFPKSAPTTGGTRINITMNGLRDDSSYVCAFGSIEVGAYVGSNSTALTCESPQTDYTLETIALMIKAANASAELALTSNPIAFVFYREPVIERVHPSIFYAEYLSDVELLGSGFVDLNDMKCRVNDQVIDVKWHSDTKVVCLLSQTALSLDELSSASVLFALNGVDFIGAGAKLQALPEIAVASIRPSKGSELGGISTLITGKGFHRRIRYMCRFGLDVVEARFIDTTSLSCVTPMVPRPKAGPFSLCIDNGVCIETNLTYTFVEPLSLIHVEPRRGPLEGGTKLSVKTNHNLSDPSYCWFGDNRVELEAREVGGTCITPSFGSEADTTQAVEFRVSTEGHHLSRELFYFIYHPARKLVESLIPTVEDYAENLVVHKITPSTLVRGSPNLALVIEVENLLLGNGDFPIDTCTVGSHVGSATLSRNESHSFRCDFEQLAILGSYPVEFASGRFGNIKASGFEIEIIDNPTLHRLEPAVVIPVSVVKFFVHGGNFVDHNLTCFINEQPYPATFMTSAQIICKVSGADLMASMYQVRVSNDGHYIQSLPSLNLEVVAIPSIAELHPPAGLPGSTVVLRGKGFHHKMKCYAHEGEELASHFVNSSAVQCALPSVRRADSVPLYLVLGDRPVSNVLNYTQIDLRMDSMHPVFGIISGGTPVLFVPNRHSIGIVKYCKFGHAVIPAAMVDDKIMCKSPPTHKTSIVRVELGVNERDFIDSGYTFQYIAVPTFLAVKPSFGSETGGETIRLIGGNFMNLGVACYFGETRVMGQWVSAEEIRCMTPPLIPGRNYSISVSMGDADVLDTSLEFEVMMKMTTVFARPSFGSMCGGSAIQIFGTNFRRDVNLACIFGDIVSTALFIGPNVMECITPSHESAEAVELGIVSENGEVSFVEDGFVFLGPFEVQSLRPDNGPVQGGTSVTIVGSGFSNAVAPIHCDFSGSASLAKVVSDGELTCMTPYTVSFGEVNVSITHGADVFDLKSQRFSYDGNVTVHDVQTRVLSSRIQHDLTVYGSAMKQKRELACKLDQYQYLLEATFVSETEIICKLPRGLPPNEYKLTVTNNGQDFSESSASVRIIDPFKLYYTDPSIGSSGVTTLVTLRGHGFEYFDGMECFINNRHFVAAQFFRSDEIQCLLPKDLHADNVSISLVLGGQSMSNELNVTFVEIRVGSIRPTFGSVNGGTAVLIGLDVGDSAVVSHCKFGEAVTAAYTVNDELVCETPPAAMPGPVLLGLSVNGRDFESIQHNFEYHNQAQVMSTFPNHGPESGGTMVRLRGKNFVDSDSLLCYFGGQSVKGEWLSDSEVLCTSPSLKPGLYHIRLTMNGVDVLNSSLYFRSDHELDIAMVTPSIGMHQGSNVTILGKSFIPSDKMLCSFGDFGAAPAVYVGPSEVRCQSPEVEIAGVIEVDVRLSLNGFDFSRSSAPFRISPLPEILSIYPTRGLVSGGTQVIVKIMHFIPGDLTSTNCVFGGVSVPATVSSSTELVCVSPSTQNDGEVPFTISTNGVDEAVSTSFLYLPTVKHVSIVPRSGPFTGGTLITVTGIHFTPSHFIQCHFGNVATDVVFLHDGQIQCTTPSHPPGVVSFHVDSFDASVDGDLAFEFYMPHQIISAYPSTGPYQGETLVTVHGRHFRSDADYLCHFGNSTSSPARFLSFDSIECYSPKIAEKDQLYSVPFAIGERGSNHTHGELSFTYGPSIIVDHVQPQLIFVEGGTISVFGDYFNASEAWCRFAHASSSPLVVVGDVIDTGRIDCQAPPYSSNKLKADAQIQVSTNAYDWSDSLSFIYSPRPIVDNLHPTLGAVSGGTLIGVSGSNFFNENDLWCNFKGAGSVLAEWESSEKIYCTSPPLLSKPLHAAVSIHTTDGSLIVNGGQYFRYHRDLLVEEVYPTRGFVTGGSRLTIFGTGFIDVDSISCHFGDELVNATFVSPTAIECVSPSMNGPQTIELGVSLNGIDVVSSRSGLTFTYDEQPGFERVVPDKVPVDLSGAVQDVKHVSIFGSSFVNGTNLRCMFGDGTWITNAILIEHNELKCALPAINKPGIYPISVSSTNGADFSQRSIDISFVKRATISSIRPSRIQEGFEALLTLSGTNFIASPDLQCHFGESRDLWRPAVWKSNSTVECKSPELNLTADGYQLVGISVNGGHSMSALFPLEVTARARFLSMYPSHGYTTGGTDVSIVLGYLRYVANRQMHCKFDEVTVPAKVSGSVISCISPPSTSGSALVLLRVEGEIQPLATGTFEYINEPTIDSIRPNIGSIDGGSNVHLKGINFEGVTHCRFNDRIVPVDASSDHSKVVCTSPSVDDAQDVSVQVTHNGQDFASSKMNFSYRAMPTLIDVMPSYGGANTRGKTVYITGRNFSPSPLLTCRFGESDVQASFISDSLISCNTPPMKLGRAMIAVSLNGINFIDSELVYETINLPQMSSLHPKVGPLNGNTTVVVSTTALPKTDRLACHFGSRIAQATRLSENSLSCIAPSVEKAQVVNVSISVDGELLYEHEEDSIGFVYSEHPMIESISPALGWTSGGANITLSVKNLDHFRKHNMVCSFGGSDSFTEAIRVQHDAVVCISPAFSDSMSIYAPIALLINEGFNSIRIPGPVFRYFFQAVITRIEPSFGSVMGGSLVKLFGRGFPNVDDLRCIFGNVTVVAEWINAGEIQCVSPRHAGHGNKEVQLRLGIESDVMLSIESHAWFKYLPNPIIHDFYPQLGGNNGGTRVLLSLVYPWQNATGHLSCRFGNSSLTTAQVISEDEVACIAPPKSDTIGLIGDNSEVSVALYSSHGEVHLSSTHEPFVYLDHIKIRSLHPNTGPSVGGTNVKIEVDRVNAVHPSALTCHFGNGVIVHVTSCVDELHAWLCECLTPQMNVSKTVLIEIGVDGRQDVPSIGQVFSFYEPPDIEAISPSTGFLEGGELVQLKGTGFRQSADLKCMFGELKTDAAFVSSTELFCTSPAHGRVETLRVSMTINGVDFAGDKEYMYMHRPDASALSPSVVEWGVQSAIVITGKHLANVKSCRFGDVERSYPVFNVTNHQLCCISPPASVYSLHQTLTTEFNVPVHLDLENGVLETQLFVRYEQPVVEDTRSLDDPIVVAIEPTFAASAGGSWIRIYGEGFVNGIGLCCHFGDADAQQLLFVSPHEIRCMAPMHIPGTVSLRVSNSGISLDANAGIDFTFFRDSSITSVYPSFGSVRGGTVVNLYGSFPTSDVVVACKFGLYGVVRGEIVTQKHVKCLSPKAPNADRVELSISIDGGSNFEISSDWFTYELEAEVLDISPSYGYRGANTTASVLVAGRNFKDVSNLKCLFGEVVTAARFISNGTVSCSYPIIGAEKKVSVSVFVEGDVKPSSWRHFEYIDPPTIASYEPVFGGATVETGEVTVKGSGFRKMFQLFCTYGNVSVRASVIDSTTVICPIPSHHPGEVMFGVVDQFSHLLLEHQHGRQPMFYFLPEPSVHTIIPMWNASKNGALSLIKGANFDTMRSTATATLTSDLIIDAFDEIDYHEHVPFVLEPKESSLATNGTYATASSHNLTLCEPGTFQPQNGQEHCLVCPVGYFCPLFGMAKPMICPAGFVCSRLGLSAPSSPCTAGHYCFEGTKMSSPIVDKPTTEWNIDEITGVVTAATANAGWWDYIPREKPATGSRRIFHRPRNMNVTAQQPFPCSLGYYCRVGVSSIEHRKGDFSTPQPCHAGNFCPRGSISPEGSGGCPAGYYCSTQDLAIPCDVGHFCPGVGNTFPLPCFPGSFSGSVGQSNCELCEAGYQCDGWGRSAPQLCKAGYVCDQQGISIPEKPCPSGYYCEEGTSTDDPQSLVGKPPLPCPPGLFCLYGVAHKELLLEVGLPSFDMALPQPCAEGYYCSNNASIPLGDGPCFKGHYCQTSSRYPIQVPPGSFAGDDGSIVPTLCLPGTFSPRPGSISCIPCPAGFSCLSYGTFKPRLCGPGTYRSKADSIPCKLCPERTYSYESGLTDISQCLPCLGGRVCGSQGLVGSQGSDICPEGHACGYATNRASQYDQKCFGGCFCANQTGLSEQYSNYCTKGHYCERGTSLKISTKGKCSQSHFCAVGTSNPEHFMTHCPKQTTTTVGSEVIESCRKTPVSVCDKRVSSLTNPFDENSYNPILNGSGEGGASEIVVVKKVLPLNSDASNVLPWKNNTIEVFRSCPTYGTIPPNTSSAETITVIGRNFQNSTHLICRFRVCRSSVLTYLGQDLVFPNTCRSEGAETNFSNPVLTRATLVNDHRVQCQLPDTDSLGDFVPLPTTSLPLSKALVCMRDQDDRVFLSLECSNEESSSGDCVFEPSIPSFGLRKKIYSLFMPCYGIDDSCTNTLNPCLTQQISVDISNNGKKFSGDATAVPYKSALLNERDGDAYSLSPTFAVYNLVRNETFDMTGNKKASFEQDLESDVKLCSSPSIIEEGLRLSDDGWFQSEYMSRVIMSFDWRHIPDHIMYNQHYRLAIYVKPSRCNEAKCIGSERKHQAVESIPCLQPLTLPHWFESEAVNKHQVVNLTMTSLDDALFKIEVQIMNGIVLPMADFFKRSLTVTIENPERARTFGEDTIMRKLSPLVSWEESPTPMVYMFGIRYDESMFDQVSPPLNLPPRWQSFEKGRMLLSMNTTHENSAPTIKDDAETMIERNKDFWSNPFPTILTAKEKADLYFETWHGLSPGDSEENYKYDHNAVILPYLPYFSNCREFDSHVPLWSVLESSSQCGLPGVSSDFPENWWRRQIPSLPHQDDVEAVGPRNFMKFYPIADWCERKLHCHFEERMSEPEVLPRWFEAENGVTLFSIIRDPIDYFQYTGRDEVTVGAGDGGGQRFIQFNDALQNYIPAKVDRSPAFNVQGGCTTNCFPRKVTLDISYQQVDVHTKRIVQIKLLYDRFDKDADNDNYELQVKFYALNFQELVIKFAFDRDLFLLLFVQIGIGTIFASFLYWIVIRVTTRLEEPPSLRIFGFLRRICPPALGGVLLGLVPISVVTSGVYYLLKGHEHFSSDTDPEGRRWLLLPTIHLNYSDSTIDPDHLTLTRQGRTGFAFLSIALVSFYYTSCMFVPKRKSTNNSTADVSSKNPDKSVTWRRSNLVYSSILMGLFLVVIVEWSFWGSFGTYIWEVIIFMKFLSMIVGSLVDAQLGEALLSAPVMTSMAMVQSIVTMSANDFMDFLLSYIVGFGFLIIERMYIGPLQADFITWLASRVEQLSYAIFPRSLAGENENTDVNDMLDEENNETVEMLLGSFANYSCDAIALLYTPFIMVVIMVFRDETEIIKMYGIKEADMEYYILFALSIIPFQFIADILLHNSLELLHGWKTLDYLEYCRARFYQRECWWKGFESNTRDECIEESLRSIDQLCFSSQYYALNTMHINAIIYFVIGVEMMVRAKYNLFGDPAMIPILGYVLICSIAVRIVMIWIGSLFGVWRIRFERRDWHGKMQVDGEAKSLDQLGDVQTSKEHDLYQMEMRITDETFRYKFLRYNRSWIISQLPDMLTPRITQKSRPYMINQLARVLGSINADISSDSEDDDYEFEIPDMSVSTRTMARNWLAQASRLLKLRRIVQPIIQQSRGNECEMCLSRNLLQVETCFTLEQMNDMFCREFGSSDDRLDDVLFQRFWRKNQRYETICLPCLKHKTEMINDDKSADGQEVAYVLTGGLNQSSERIMHRWYSIAKAATRR